MPVMVLASNGASASGGLAETAFDVITDAIEAATEEGKKGLIEAVQALKAVFDAVKNKTFPARPIIDEFATEEQAREFLRNLQQWKGESISFNEWLTLAMRSPKMGEDP